MERVAKVPVYKLAHELGVESSWVLATLRTMGWTVRSEEGLLRPWQAARVSDALYANYETLVESGVIDAARHLLRPPVASICTACGCILGANEICRCRRAENAGRPS